ATYRTRRSVRGRPASCQVLLQLLSNDGRVAKNCPPVACSRCKRSVLLSLSVLCVGHQQLQSRQLFVLRTQETQDTQETQETQEMQDIHETQKCVESGNRLVPNNV